MAPYLKLYIEYVNNYPLAITRLGKFSNSKFSSLLEKQKKESKINLGLGALLIMPVQRGPRYELLLRDLLKSLPNKHAQYFILLTEAQEAIVEMNKEINARKKEFENLNALWEIQNAFSFTYMPESLVAPHRKLIHSGKLKEHEKTIFGNNVFPVDVFLMNDCLILAYLGQTITDVRKGYKKMVNKLKGSNSPPFLQSLDLDRKFLTFKIVGLTNATLLDTVAHFPSSCFALIFPANNRAR
eukprot:CAMPEP_0174279710 /NCGR_PEP_ID=MMETSP0439-20130205/62183_1 /TAXON_ID=0 /ORGANISM="Stereomyxa ramosa, Strain Chinc5" /LENGTH=240 /DNA_ID=CAMNT_0015372259 /DNA_START=126 /DNA_END=844 /DNA_ORIENTATION=+